VGFERRYGVNQVEIRELVVLAQAGDPGGSPISMLLMMGSLGLVFYALVWHPQRRQDREQREMRDALQKGDHVVTSGGIHGKITGVAADVVTVEIAERVRVKLNRSAVAGKINPAATATVAKAPDERAKGESKS
jgi:preprotein translocase subunit YajC